MSTDVLKYKDFIGSVQFSGEDEIFWGKIIGINDSITFEGASVQELKKNFKGAVDDYIALCKRHNKPAQKSMTGSFNIRINPALHQLATYAAAEQGISLNKYIQQAIVHAVEEPSAQYHTTPKKKTAGKPKKSN